MSATLYALAYTRSGPRPEDVVKPCVVLLASEAEALDRCRELSNEHDVLSRAILYTYEVGGAGCVYAGCREVTIPRPKKYKVLVHTAIKVLALDEDEACDKARRAVRAAGPQWTEVNVALDEPDTPPAADE